MTQLEKLKEKLSSGIVMFSYRKTNGEIRNACGTNNVNCTPLFNQSNKTRKDSLRVCDYYDLTKQNWRRFKEEELIRIGSHVLA